MEKQTRNRVHPLPAILFWTLIWFLAAHLTDSPLLLPGPLQVLGCMGRLAVTGSFWRITAISIGRILMGVGAAVLLGILLAVATEAVPLLHTLIAPAMTAIQATPVASFAVLVLIWLDRDSVPILICTLMGLPLVWSSVAAGIRQVDVSLLEMARVYRLSGALTLRRVYIPSVMPFFRSACVNALGLGWKAGIAAEVLTVPKSSIGRMISESKLYLLTEELFAWTLTVVLLSLLLQKLMLLALKERRVHA